MSSTSYNWASLRGLGCPILRLHRVLLHSHRGPRISCSCHRRRISLVPKQRRNRRRELQPSLLQRVVVCYCSRVYFQMCPLGGHQWCLYRRCTTRYVLQWLYGGTATPSTFRRANSSAKKKKKKSAFAVRGLLCK